jgi:hypothetical protein
MRPAGDISLRAHVADGGWVFTNEGRGLAILCLRVAGRQSRHSAGLKLPNFEALVPYPYSPIS